MWKVKSLFEWNINNIKLVIYESNRIGFIISHVCHLTICWIHTCLHQQASSFCLLSLTEPETDLSAETGCMLFSRWPLSEFPCVNPLLSVRRRHPFFSVLTVRHNSYCLVVVWKVVKNKNKHQLNGWKSFFFLNIWILTIFLILVSLKGSFIYFCMPVCLCKHLILLSVREEGHVTCNIRLTGM